MSATNGAPAFLAEVASTVAAAAAIAYLSFRLGLLPIVGFLLAGVAIGPHALGLVSDPELVDAAAEAGVILLMFTIGIEFSLERLSSLKRLIFVGGGLQVVLSTAVTVGALALVGVDWRAGVFTGFLVSLSSTAIVLKVIGDRGDAISSYGQASIGLLIFQDLAIIVMVMLVPMLGGAGGSAGDVALAVGKALTIIAVVLLVARRVMPPVLERVALTCSPELFLLTVVAICFGTAWLTSVAGVSVSLGAFLAGLLVSESRFSHHALGEVMPLQILFSATFFVSVGMLLDGAFLIEHPLLVVGAVAFVLLIKVVTTVGSVLALRYPMPVAAAAGLTLAQVGEFSFVLDRTGAAVGLSPAGMGTAGSQSLIATTVLLMVATPRLASFGARLADRLERRHDARALAAVELPDASHGPFADFENHVVVAGYGDAARQLVRVLRGSKVPFLITTLSPGGANEAEAAGLPVLRGDASRQHTLLIARVDRAKMVVIADDDAGTAGRIAAATRELAPTVRILVRTRYESDTAALVTEGADLVIADELESVVQMFAEVLRNYAIPPASIEEYEHAIRGGGYAALRAADGGSSFECQVDIDCLQTPRVNVRPGASGEEPVGEIVFHPRHGTGCSHLDQIHSVRPGATGCEDCLRIGGRWVHLRICLTCGHVGCCDSSPNRHATAHFHAAGHPIVRSMERGETWGWCYVEEVML